MFIYLCIDYPFRLRSPLITNFSSPWLAALWIQCHVYVTVDWSKFCWNATKDVNHHETTRTIIAEPCSSWWRTTCCGFSQVIFFSPSWNNSLCSVKPLHGFSVPSMGDTVDDAEHWHIESVWFRHWKSFHCGVRTRRHVKTTCWWPDPGHQPKVLVFDQLGTGHNKIAFRPLKQKDLNAHVMMSDNKRRLFSSKLRAGPINIFGRF